MRRERNSFFNSKPSLERERKFTSFSNKSPRLENCFGGSEMNTQNYFKMIEEETRKVYSVAEEARKRGWDPVDKVEIPLARSLAEKVVGLISAVYPQMENSGIAESILELEKENGKLDPMVAFKI